MVLLSSSTGIGEHHCIELVCFCDIISCNSFGLIPAAALQVPEPLMPGASSEVSLPVNTSMCIVVDSVVL